MKTREELQAEFIELRNALVRRPKGHEGARIRNLYYNHLIDSDGLAQMKSDDELVKAIERLKARNK